MKEMKEMKMLEDLLLPALERDLGRIAHELLVSWQRIRVGL